MSRLRERLEDFRKLYEGLAFIGDGLFVSRRNWSFRQDLALLRAGRRAMPDTDQWETIWREHVTVWALRTALPVPGLLIQVGDFGAFGTSFLGLAAELVELGRSVVGRASAASVLADAPAPLAFMQLDLPVLRDEIAVLERLWSMAQPGTVALIGEYGLIRRGRERHQALQVYFEGAGAPLLEIPTGQGFAIKR